MRYFKKLIKKYTLVMLILIVGIVGSLVGLIKKQIYHMENIHQPAIAYVFKSADDPRMQMMDDTDDEEIVHEDTESVTTESDTNAVSGVSTTPQTQPTTQPSVGTASFVEVDADYFKDAVFVGDSRIEDLAIDVPELDKVATFYGKASLSVYNVLDEEWIETENGTINADTALQQNTFGKVYLLVGINEMGYGTTDAWIDAYRKVINRVEELQPNALIFLIGNSHVSEEVNGEYDITNEKIDERNAALSKLADMQKIFYFDIIEGLDDENGFLKADLTYDGTHLYASEYYRIYDIIKAHGIKK